MRPTIAPQVHTATPGGPTSDLVNDVAELIRQSISPTVTARTIVDKVRGHLERVERTATQVDRDLLAVALERFCNAYDEPGVPNLAAAHREAVDLLTEVRS